MKYVVIFLSFILSCIYLYLLNKDDEKCLYGIKFYSKENEFHIHHWIYFILFLILLNIKNNFIIKYLSAIFIGIILSDIIFIPQISMLLFNKEIGCNPFII